MSEIDAMDFSSIDYSCEHKFQLSQSSILDQKVNEPIKQRNTCDSDEISVQPKECILDKMSLNDPKVSTFLEDLNRFTKQISFQSEAYDVYNPDISTAVTQLDEQAFVLSRSIHIENNYIIDFGSKRKQKKANNQPISIKITSKAISLKLRLEAKLLEEISRLTLNRTRKRNNFAKKQKKSK